MEFSIFVSKLLRIYYNIISVILLSLSLHGIDPKRLEYLHFLRRIVGTAPANVNIVSECVIFARHIVILLSVDILAIPLPYHYLVHAVILLACLEVVGIATGINYPAIVSDAQTYHGVFDIVELNNCRLRLVMSIALSGHDLPYLVEGVGVHLIGAHILRILTFIMTSDTMIILVLPLKIIIYGIVVATPRIF